MPETLRDWSVIFFLRVFSGRYCQKQSCDVLEERSHPLRNRLNPQNPLRRLPGVLAVLHDAAKTAIGGSYAQYRANNEGRPDDSNAARIVGCLYADTDYSLDFWLDPACFVLRFRWMDLAQQLFPRSSVWRPRRTTLRLHLAIERSHTLRAA